jgi:3-deoxy-D-arabino-heptulosonate 7-phosphate (DAHP) synthase
MWKTHTMIAVLVSLLGTRRLGVSVRHWMDKPRVAAGLRGTIATPESDGN